MPTALVTGATGMVGTYTTQRLLREGWNVRALVRDPTRIGALGAAVELRVGDTLDAASVATAARDCALVVHAAAAITPSGGWDAFRLPNIEGTRNVISAAEHAGARLAHVSSVAVYGSRYQPTGRTSEDSALAPLPTGAYYARSKRESEELVLDAHGKGRVWATAVRPDVIYGRYDRQFVPRVARLLRYGVAPLVGGGGTTLAIVHAEHVADGIVRAALCDIAGGRVYNLANDFDVTVAEFFRLAGVGLGRDLRTLRIPRGVALGAVSLLGAVAPLLGGGATTAVMASSMDFLTRDNPFTSDRARRELGWCPSVRPEAGVVDAFRWILTHA